MFPRHPFSEDGQIVEVFIEKNVSEENNPKWETGSACLLDSRKNPVRCMKRRTPETKCFRGSFLVI